LIGYQNTSYLSDPHKRRSQIDYLFTYEGTTISWRFVKQILVATLSNHLEIIAIHEASWECIWLKKIIQHIKEKCRLSTFEDSPTILFEDNVVWITQLRGCYIKGDKTKHISPKFSYTYELQHKGKINIKQIRLGDNLAYLFTKSLPASTFKKLVHYYTRISRRSFKNFLVGKRTDIWHLILYRKMSSSKSRHLILW
jgi:hypothetical protein